VTPTRGLVVDTSAAIAVLTGEVGGDWLREILSESRRSVMPAATYLELGIVIESRLGLAGTGVAARFVRDAAVEIVDVSAQAAERALEGWRRFGKGRHPASLNFGDCIVYGTALELDLHILCTGDDFARTNVAVLRPPAEPGTGGA
jgi:ribonuclease VapC